MGDQPREDAFEDERARVLPQSAEELSPAASEPAGEDSDAEAPEALDQPVQPVLPPPAVAAPAAPPLPPAPSVAASGAPMPTAAPTVTAPADAEAPTPSAGSAWLKVFTARVLLGGLAHVGIAVGAAFIGAVVLLILLMASGASTSLSSTPLPSLDDLQAGGAAVIGFLFTLTGFVYGGEITAGIGGSSGLLSGAGTASLWAFPLTVTVAALIVVLWWGVRQERVSPLPTALHRAAYGVAVGLTAGLVLLLLTAIFAVRGGGAGVQVEISAAGIRLVLFTTLLVGGAAFLGRWAGTAAQPQENCFTSATRALRGTPRLVRETLAYGAFGAALFGVLGAIFIVVAAWRDLGAGTLALAPVLFFNVAPFAAALGHFGGISAAGSLGGPASGQTVTVFNADEPMLWLLVLAAVLLSAFVALWIGTRRPRRAGGIDGHIVWQLPVVVLGAWIVLGTVFFGFGFGATGAVGMFGGTAGVGIGIALWSALVFLAWAALVELGAQTLPAVAYGLAPGAHAALAGRTAVANWVAGGSVAATGVAALDTSGDASASGTNADAVAVNDASAPGVTATGVPAAPAQPVSPPAPLSPAAKRGLLIGLVSLGAIVLLAVAASIAVAVANSARSPEAVAQEYLEHIAAGRAEAANALVDPDVPNSQRAFLTDEVLGSASERITDVTAKGLRVDGSDTAFVTVTYRLDGVQQEEQLTVSKGEPEFLVLDNWIIEDSLARPIELHVNGQGSSSIGGVEVPITSDGLYGQGQIALYPGVYTLTSTGSKFFELEDDTLMVGGLGSPFAFPVNFVPTDALADEVASQVNALLQECTTQTSADPDGCPFQAFTFDESTPVSWTLQGEPKVELDDSGARVSVEGVAVGSYTEDFFGTTRQRDDEDRFFMNAAVSVDGDTVTVSFDDSWW